MNRAEVLHTAESCVCGKREEDYGTPENNFACIADMWNAYLKHAECGKTGLLKPEDVSVLMALFKIGRIATGTKTDDSFVDGCGYLACAAEIVAENRDKKVTK